MWIIKLFLVYIMATLIEQLIAKLGLKGENHILEKTKELIRLLELRSSSISIQISEYGKIVLCVDLAANILGIVCDKDAVLKLSGLRRKVYQNQKRVLEKLLDLNKIMEINDICIQMNVTEIAKSAEKLLNSYRKGMAAHNVDIGDPPHPQYSAMAIFVACKHRNQKISKTKLMSYSHLRPTQWQKLEQSWKKIVDETSNKLNNEILTNRENDNPQESTIQSNIKFHKSKLKPQSIENYEDWKIRILASATLKLGQISQNN